MIFDKYFKGNTADLDWEYIETIPEFAKLKECEQSPKWHKEGNAWEHTVRCVNAACKRTFPSDSVYARRIAIASVLFHDIGKGTTTTFTKGSWHAYGHEFAGEKIARRILWNEPIEAREAVCNAVRYHMEVLRIAESKDLISHLILLSMNFGFSWETLLFVKTCDILGSEPEDAEQSGYDLAKIDFLKEMALSLGIYRSRFSPLFSNYNEMKVTELLDGRKINWTGKPSQKVYLLIGLPGAGKNTFIDWAESIKVLSRDDIRTELGYTQEGEKAVLSEEKEKEVSDIFNKRMLEYAANGESFVINNINLKKRYRDEYRRALAKFPIEWVYIYIEAPSIEENIKRRPTFDPNVLRSMCETLEWPHAEETCNLIVEKQKQSFN